MEVNVTLASWSMLLIYSAGAVYALAFIIYAFDLFGGKKKRVGKAAGSAGASARGSAGAAKGAKRTARTRTSAEAGSAGDDSAVGTLVQENLDGPADRVYTNRAADDAGDGSGHVDGSAAGGAAERRVFANVGTSLTVLALLLHIASIVTRGLSVMRAPWGNMMEYALIASAVAGVVYAVTLRYKDVRYLGTFVTGFLLVSIGLATTVFYTPAAPLVPALQSYWILIHVPIAILSTGLLTVSAALATVQLLQGAREKRVAAGRDAGWLSFLERMPRAASIEAVSYRLAAVGFITWTFTVIAGAIWAEVAWGRYWGWDAKEIWSFVIWVVYAAYLHSRATRGLRLTTIAWLNLIGFITIIFNFTVVNVYFNGLHSYSGL